MPRQSKGPYLEFKRYRDRESRWVIRDGQKTKGTGLGTGASDEQKRQALADYLKKIHDPSPKRGGDPNQALVADCLAYYLTKRLKRFEDNPPPEEDRRAWSRKKEDESIHTRLVKFFGTCTVGELTGAEQTKYTEQRGSVSSARRELNVLTAAINYYYRQSGGMQMIFRPTLPDAVAPRERWLTRQEAAKLLWAAWRARQTDRGGGKGRHVGKHLARYLLVSLYTCTRKGAVCDAAMMPTVGRGYVNLDTGKFHRKADGAVESNKRQPTIDLPPRLLAHMRRWQRLGIAKRYLVEWNGKPVRNIRKAFERARVAAGLDDKVIPHTLRDTAVSWYLRQGVSPSVVADYAGMSEQILRRVYKHHLPGAFAPIMDASKTFGRFDQNPMFSRESPYRFRTSNG